MVCFNSYNKLHKHLDCDNIFVILPLYTVMIDFKANNQDVVEPNQLQMFCPAQFVTKYEEKGS